MAYEYDRFEREDNGGAFLMGLLVGTVLGAGLGMLFAPKTGSELRSQLSDGANKLQRAASEGYQQASEKVSHIVDRGKEAYDKARGSLSHQTEAMSDMAPETYEAGRDAIGRSTERMRGAGDSEFGGSGDFGTPGMPGRTRS